MEIFKYIIILYTNKWMYIVACFYGMLKLYVHRVLDTYKLQPSLLTILQTVSYNEPITF